MARVFLHIGSHKTGTSYVQALFHQNRALLGEAGLHYPDIGPNNAHHALAASWITMPDVPDSFWRKTGGPDQLWEGLIDTYAKAPGTLFLSAENFSRVHPERVDVSALRQRLSAFEEVRLIYTLRPQTELIQSTWMQIARERKAPTLRSFVEAALEKRRAGGVPIDHHTLYHTWRSAFAAEEITLLDYDTIRAHPAGIAGAFLEEMGIPLPAASLVAPPRAAANISPDPLALVMASLVNADQPPPEALIHAMQGIIRPNPALPTSLLLAQEYKRICRKFSAGNATLVDLVQPVQPGFHFTQADPGQQRLYRNALSGEVWMAVARMLYETPELRCDLSANGAPGYLERIKKRL